MQSQKDEKTADARVNEFYGEYIFISEKAHPVHALHVLDEVVEDNRGERKLWGFRFFKLLF